MQSYAHTHTRVLARVLIILFDNNYHNFDPKIDFCLKLRKLKYLATVYFISTYTFSHNVIALDLIKAITPHHPICLYGPEIKHVYTQLANNYGVFDQIYDNNIHRRVFRLA